MRAKTLLGLVVAAAVVAPCVTTSSHAPTRPQVPQWLTVLREPYFNSNYLDGVADTLEQAIPMIDTTQHLEGHGDLPLAYEVKLEPSPSTPATQIRFTHQHLDTSKGEGVFGLYLHAQQTHDFGASLSSGTFESGLDLYLTLGEHNKLLALQAVPVILPPQGENVSDSHSLLHVPTSTSISWSLEPDGTYSRELQHMGVSEINEKDHRVGYGSFVTINLSSDSADIPSSTVPQRRVETFSRIVSDLVDILHQPGK